MDADIIITNLDRDARMKVRRRVDAQEQYLGTKLDETKLELPQRFGVGTFQVAQLSNGSSLTVSRCNPDTPIVSEIMHREPFIGLVFCLEGQIDLEFPGTDAAANVPGGQFCLFGAFAMPVVRRSQAGQTVETVVLKMPVSEFNHRFGILRDGEGLAGVFRAIATRTCFERGGAITASMQLALRALQNCPFDDACRALFLEGKALELQSAAIAALCPERIDDGRKLTSSEADRLLHARSLLVADLSAPPTLDALAARIGMSHTRLNRGFKREFGSTVFEYLRLYRLEQAKFLLASSETSITEISHALGFASASHFASQFRAQFKLSPTAYRITEKPQIKP